MLKLIVALLISTSLLFSAPPKEYSEGYQFYKEKKYERSIEVFSKLLEQSPDGYYSGNVFYWFGMIDFNKKDYNSSILNFEKVLTCKNKWKYADALLKIANCYERKGEKDLARVQYQELYAMYEKQNNLVREDILKIVKGKLGK
jgi:TolA-binding protein